MLGLCGLGQDSFHGLGPRCNAIQRQVHWRIIASELYWALEGSVPFIKTGFIFGLADILEDSRILFGVITFSINSTKKNGFTRLVSTHKIILWILFVTLISSSGCQIVPTNGLPF